MFNLRQLFIAAIHVTAAAASSARQKMAAAHDRISATGTSKTKADVKMKPRKRGDACIRVNVVNNSSRYAPHQSHREIARRRSQIARGILATN